MSQLFAFITSWQNSLSNWMRREIVDDDPWDEQISNSLDDSAEPKISVIESVPETDTPESTISVIQQ